MFSGLSKYALAKAALFKNQPIYVQFYLTSRCNLRCVHCNIIYANSDLPECSLEQVEMIAENLARLKVAIVLLTGGEPFMRQDLPAIIKAFESRGVHVRMQTNGLASEEQIASAVEAGGRDISISLDTLKPELQEKINGGIPGSWHRALKAIADFTRVLPKRGSFASLGCVLQTSNLNDIEDVIKFATSIHWFTSLVPVHITPQSEPYGFRSLDPALDFESIHHHLIDDVLGKCRHLQKQGCLLYDSPEYLDDISAFVRKRPLGWRRRNRHRCDSPGLYFAILPDGEFAPCCDHRLQDPVYVYADDFVPTYHSRGFKASVMEITSHCQGCLFGSFPEITIAMRFWRAKMQRLGNFLAAPVRKTGWPLTYERVLEMAAAAGKA